MRIWKPAEQEHIEIVIELEPRLLNQNVLIVPSLFDYLLFQNRVENLVNFVLNANDQKSFTLF